jgi:tetratricopeptide (TPR) repeat protein
MISVLNSKAFALAAILLIALPQAVMAHGELLIRIAAITRQIQAATNNPATLYLQRGELHREHRDWQAAASDYDSAARFDPKLLALDRCRATMLADAGKLDEALALFNKAIDRSPSEGLLYLGRARVLANLGRCDAAITDFRHGINLLREPVPDCFRELAEIQVANAQTNSALQSLDDGIRKFGPILLLQAYALDLELRCGNNEAALTRLDTILPAAPRKEGWFARRGDILLALGRPGEARIAYEAALKATDILPPPLQRGPPIQKLRSRVNAALAVINIPTLSKLDGKTAP